jgi:transcription antitermination factor NusG
VNTGVAVSKFPDYNKTNRISLISNVFPVKKNWYVIYTRSNCEKKVAALLAKRDIEHYCPLNRVVKKWADRKKIIYEPLFCSYVFVKAAEQELYLVKQASGDIVNFVYWLGRPAIIKDIEIENIRLFLSEYSNVLLEKSIVSVGDTVRILSGPLMNMEGNIQTVENNKVKLVLPSLGYAMIAEMKISNVEVIDLPYRARKIVS